jgi:hypothetical protein
VVTLADGQRHVGVLAYALERFRVLVPDRILDVEGSVRRGKAGQFDGPLGIIPAMAFEDEVHFIAHGFPDGRQVFDLLPDGELMLVEVLRIVAVKGGEDVTRQVAPALSNSIRL